jgi:ubiquitin-like 1-activating enzyme E1 B
VAKESALRFNPHVSIESHQADIKSKEFNVDWFKQFTMVLNALDNLGKGTKMGSQNKTNVCCLRWD